MTEEQLTPEQLTALTEWAELHGRQWKHKLNIAWMYHRYDDFPKAGTLQGIRNQFGPSWLVRFSLTKAKGSKQ